LVLAAVVSDITTVFFVYTGVAVTMPFPGNVLALFV
jgi:hypothetical protein